MDPFQDSKQTEIEIEYGRTIIQLAGERSRSVYLRVTGIVGLAVLFLTQLPFQELVGTPRWTRWAFLVGVVSALASGAFYFRYLTMLDLARLEMAKLVLIGRGREVGQIWSGDGSFWVENRWLFRCGTAAAAISVSTLGLALTTLLDLL